MTPCPAVKACCLADAVARLERPPAAAGAVRGARDRAPHRAQGQRRHPGPLAVLPAADGRRPGRQGAPPAAALFTPLPPLACERGHQNAEDGAPPCTQTARPLPHLFLSSPPCTISAAWRVARKENLTADVWKIMPDPTAQGVLPTWQCALAARAVRAAVGDLHAQSRRRSAAPLPRCAFDSLSLPPAWRLTPAATRARLSGQTGPS